MGIKRTMRFHMQHNICKLKCRDLGSVDLDLSSSCPTTIWTILNESDNSVFFALLEQDYMLWVQAIRKGHRKRILVAKHNSTYINNFQHLFHEGFNSAVHYFLCVEFIVLARYSWMCHESITLGIKSCNIFSLPSLTYKCKTNVSFH